MKRNVLLSLLTILFLAFSLAMLPYVGLPYEPLEATGLQVGVYGPSSKVFLPLFLR